MSEGDDYTPAPWAAQHDFTSARQDYDQYAGRSYADASAASVVAEDLVPASIETRSSHPFFIRTDDSGSMGGWPGVMFSKFPYLDHEVRTEYLGEDAQISFGAIGDVYDSYALQVRQFTIGEGLKDALLKLIIEQGGSGPGHHCEAYLLAALYDCRNAKFPRSAGKPPYIIIGDEMPYTHVTRGEGQRLPKVTMEESRMTAEQVIAELTAKFSVYLILKPYGDEEIRGDRLESSTQQVYDRWVGLIGADRIALLPSADRVVDVIFGLLASHADKVEYFRGEIEGRQRPDQVATVYKSLLTVHGADPDANGPKKPGASTLHRPPGGKKSSGLLK